VPNFYRFDDVEIDVPNFRLLKAGKAVPMEPKALNLLVFLIENRGRLVEKRELFDAIWHQAFVTDSVLTRLIAQLRKVLGDNAKEARYIETVPTLGYRFIANVEVEGPEEAKGPESKRPAAVVPTSSNPALKSARWGAVAAAIVLVICLAVGGWLFFTRKAHALTDKDTIVLAEFGNTTGDAVLMGRCVRDFPYSWNNPPF